MFVMRRGAFAACEVQEATGFFVAGWASCLGVVCSPLEPPRVNSLSTLPKKPSPIYTLLPQALLPLPQGLVHLFVPSVVLEYKIPIARNNFHQ